MNPILRRYLLLALAGLFVLIALGLNQAAVYRTGGGGGDALAAVRELSTQLAEASALANAASRGAPDFNNLGQTLRAAEASMAKLKTAGGAGGTSGPFDDFRDAAQETLAAQELHTRVNGHASTVATGAANIFPVYEQLAEKLAQRSAPSSQIYMAAGQLIRLERLGAAARALASAPAASDVEMLEREGKAFGRANRALAEPPPELAFVRDAAAEGLARKAGEDFAPAVEAIAALLTDAPAALELAIRFKTLDTRALQALAAVRGQERTLGGGSQAAGQLPFFALVAGALALLLLGAHAINQVRSQRAADARAKRLDAERQGAILRLLDEITNLANGDLTGTLTVTEDFTGNIADSLNYTVDTLRTLVGTINVTSVEIAAAAANTTRSAQQMNEASEGQAREIVVATQGINAASRSLQDVSARAERIAEQAKSSVEVAHNGAATVGRTIQGMSTLREQIQDTAKRIKRLGESSQEIGNIIEFINDIAEQTNTLALNASIQAAMAGEAGRGFAVVADEVQRLSERAGSATRQIESLVKTIQADTQEAVTSMERSTANVVGGAKSAEEAGLALTRIESSSQELSRLIQEISGAARTQSADTNRLSDTMQSIRGISVQTSAQAQQTAQAVGELNVLSSKLRESVSGFKLPSDVTSF